MLRWLRRDGGLAHAGELLDGMLADGRQVFDLAMRARVGAVDPAEVAEELYATEERTDESEREIRRRVVVHASTHGSRDLTSCLLYMSVAKDAERIGDLSKGLFDIAETVDPPPAGPLRDDLTRLAEEVSPLITAVGEAFGDDDVDRAERLIAAARRLQAQCKSHIRALLREEEALPQPAASALTYRHVSRINANLLNIASAVVMPLDQLDYPPRPGDRDRGDDAGAADGEAAGRPDAPADDPAGDGSAGRGR